MKFQFKTTIWEETTVPPEYEQMIFDKIKSGEITSANEIYDVMSELKAASTNHPADTHWHPDTQILYDTQEQMSIIDNGGQSTVEVVEDKNGFSILWSNAEEIISEDNNSTPKFPNGFDDWHETHYQIVSIIVQEEKREASQVLNNASTGELWELAKDWTDQFEKEYQGRDWADGDYFDTIEEFINEKIFPNESN